MVFALCRAAGLSMGCVRVSFVHVLTNVYKGISTFRYNLRCSSYEPVNTSDTWFGSHKVAYRLWCTCYDDGGRRLEHKGGFN